MQYYIVFKTDESGVYIKCDGFDVNNGMLQFNSGDSIHLVAAGVWTDVVSITEADYEAAMSDHSDYEVQ